LRLVKKNNSKLSDEELLAAYCKTSDPEYFGELYNRYIPLLYGLCLKYLQQEEKAEDAVMQLFEELFPKIASYEIKTFRTWIYSVAKNHCLQLLRKNDPEITVDFSTQFMEFADMLHLLNDEESDDERWKLLQSCLEKLPEKQQVAIRKFFYEEMSYADIVEATDYQLKNVKSYIQNGKRNLKICIENNMPS
jgi:RNA polymerase sigma-70 factor (ECF subfamily)